MTENDHDVGLGPPPDETGPFFVYGSLMPGELGYDQLESQIASAEPATIGGALYYRDGLPLLVDKDGEVHGFLLTFHARTTDSAWQIVRNFEPRHLYRWDRRPVNTSRKTVAANVLLGISPNKGSVHEDFQSWSTASDPLFGEGINEVRAMTLQTAPEGVPVEPDIPEYWSQFFRLQAAYLLMWSVAERYTALCFGPGVEPTRRVNRLDDQPYFREAVRASGAIPHSVIDSRRPDQKEVLRSDGAGAAGYWYQVRSNLGHRGKSAFRDGKLVFKSLVELHDTMRIVLVQRLPQLAERWRDLDPTGEEFRWLLLPCLPSGSTEPW